MPIRFFCDHCKQMLKIGTSKVGSVVDCPRCKQSIVVPIQSSPQAEEWYQENKKKRPQTSPSPAGIPANGIPSVGISPAGIPTDENASPMPTWEELETEDAEMPLWMEDAWIPPQTDFPPPFPVSTVNPDLAEEIALNALKKRYKYTIALLNLAMVLVFVVGTVFGIFVRDMFFAPPDVSQQAVGNSVANEVSGVLYYFNEDGERRADVDAVVIGLPKDRPPSVLISYQGLRPADTPNNDTIQMIHEMNGIYEKADANGAFSFPYKEGERYVLLFVSANQQGVGSEMKPSVLQELRRFFRDPELLAENTISLDEYEWTGGKYSLRHTFETAE